MSGIMSEFVTDVVEQAVKSWPHCAWEGCPLPARFAPQLRVPAKGYALNRVRPLRLICTIVLCDQHIGSITPEILLNDALRENFEKAAAQGSGGTLRPDFMRAWVHPVSINSPEYKKHERAKQRESVKAT